jgi:endonuclease/exonuclease/phosphatase family metal-dependent hydrolase
LLQETDVNAARTHYRNIAREIAQTLRMNYVFGCEFEELTQGDRHSPAYHGQATLSRLPLSASRIIRFASQSGFWRPRWFIPKIGPFQRRLGARMALVSHVEWFEKQLVVYNVHLESRSSDALRYDQLAEIFNDARQFSSEVPAIVAGDFNLDLSEKTVASMISDAKFNNPFHSGKAHQTTMPSRLRRSRAIDWILTRGPINCAEPDLHDSVCASDHYPLSLSLLCK